MPNFDKELAKQNGMSDAAIEAADSIKKNQQEGQIQYPYNKAKTFASGHKWEFNETEDNEYINLRHGTTGAYIKMFANGDIQIHTPVRDVNVIAARHINVKTGTRLDSQDPSKNDRFVLNVTGNVHLDIEGDMHTNIKGNRYTTINGEDNLTIKGPALYNYSELGENITGDHKCEAGKSITTAANIQRDLKEGGLMRDSFAGTYIIEQTSPGGIFQLKSEGDMQIDVKGHLRTTVESNSINDITGKVEWNVGGKKVIGAPTGQVSGSIGASTPSFNINTSSGKINISAAGQFGMDCGSTSLFDSGGNMEHKAPRIDLN
jgi:hypothetical protein